MNAVKVENLEVKYKDFTDAQGISFFGCGDIRTIFQT